MKIAAIVQARMTSTRLPGKVLKEVLHKPLLSYQLERLRRVRNVDEIIIATTVNETDQPIVDWCQRESVPVYRGSEEDVLSRYYEAAAHYQADAVVRITSDCPLIDPHVVERIVRFYLDHEQEIDYVSNTLERSYPRGMDTEVFSFQVLKQAYREGLMPADREHVTPYIYRNPEKFRLASLTSEQDLSFHRWTVDTPEDFELVRRLLETLYPQNPEFTMSDALFLLERNPGWVQINSMVEQKQIEQRVVES